MQEFLKPSVQTCGHYSAADWEHQKCLQDWYNGLGYKVVKFAPLFPQGPYETPMQKVQAVLQGKRNGPTLRKEVLQVLGA